MSEKETFYFTGRGRDQGRREDADLGHDPGGNPDHHGEDDLGLGPGEKRGRICWFLSVGASFRSE